MKRALRITLIAIAALLLTLLVGPFLVPVPPLEGTLPPELLVDPDSQFVEANDLKVHYKTAGEGQPPLVLLHGFASSVHSWEAVMPALGEEHAVLAFDRPAFGLTERPLEWQGQNPYSPEAQVDLTIAMMEALDIERAVLVGHSLGGSVAMHTALEHPQRVEALILVSPAVMEMGGPYRALRPFFNTPQMERLGPLLVRGVQNWGMDILTAAWHDPSKLSQETIEAYRLPLKVENWDRALWEFTTASRMSGLADRLDEFQLPVLVITGDDDRLVPSEHTIEVAGAIPGAELVVIPACGHLAQEECPQAFREAVIAFLQELP